jgi:mono/diheme cytochrome c family protein
MKLRLLVICLLSTLAFASCGDGRRGEAAFTAHCGVCHSLERPRSLEKEPGAWRFTVERMAAKNPAAFSPEQIKAIAAYLIYAFTPPVRTLVAARCGSCHDLPALAAAPLSPFEFAYLADTCRARVSARVGVDETRRIVAWGHHRRVVSQAPSCLRCHPGDAARAAKSSPSPVLACGPHTDRERLLQACGACHTTNTLSERLTPRDWESVLDRMAHKSAAPLDANALRIIRAYVLDLAKRNQPPWFYSADATLQPELHRRLPPQGAPLQR